MQADDASTSEPFPDEPAPARRALDPATGDLDELVRTLLPALREEYVRAWESLADPAHAIADRRRARERIQLVAAEHATAVTTIRRREPALAGDARLRAHQLGDDLHRIVEAVPRMCAVSPHSLVQLPELRPESLGCGTGYRDPSSSTVPAAPRAVVEHQRGPGARGGLEERGRSGGRGSNRREDRR